MTDLSNLEGKLSQMAERLLEKALNPAPKKQLAEGEKPELQVDAVDVFKAVSTWHIAMKKATKGDDPENNGTFSDLRGKLRSAA